MKSRGSDSPTLIPPHLLCLLWFRSVNFPAGCSWNVKRRMGVDLHSTGYAVLCFLEIKSAWKHAYATDVSAFLLHISPKMTRNGVHVQYRTWCMHRRDTMESTLGARQNVCRETSCALWFTRTVPQQSTVPLGPGLHSHYIHQTVPGNSWVAVLEPLRKRAFYYCTNPPCFVRFLR